MLYLLERIVAGKGNAVDIGRLEELAQTVARGSLCGLGQTAPNPVLTTLRYFPEEYRDHVERKQCAAFVCRPLMRHRIDAARCPGCTACVKVCPTEAITGARSEPHVINEEICTQCGSCLSVCPPSYAAVYRVSGELTRYEEIRAGKRKPVAAGGSMQAVAEESEACN